MKHTPEPWIAIPANGIVDAKRSIIQANNGYLAEYWSLSKNINSAANAKRACQCVNALAGIPDPQEWISNAVELLAMAHALVGNPGTNISGSTDMACAKWQQKYTAWINLNEVTR